MLFTIVFNEYGATLDTADMETAFHACDIPQLVQAVVNAETGKVLWGSLSDPEKDLELEKVQAKKRLYDMEHKTPCTKLTAEDIMRKHRENKVGGITRANNGTATGCWSYPHPIKSDAPLCGYDFKSEYILKVKTINKVEHKYEMRYYELDKRGYEHALKDVTSMYENHNNNWTETQSLFDAQFLHQDDNGGISQLYRFNFFLR